MVHVQLSRRKKLLAVACDRCGALVIDAEQHEIFHRNMQRAQRRADEAVRNSRWLKDKARLEADRGHQT